MLGKEFNELYKTQFRYLALEKGYSSSQIIEELGIDKEYGRQFAVSSLKRAISYLATGFQSEVDGIDSYEESLTEEEREEWKRRINANRVPKKKASIAGVIERGMMPWNLAEERRLLILTNLPAFNVHGQNNCQFISKYIGGLTGIERSIRSVGNKISKLKSLEGEMYRTTAKESAEVFLAHEDKLAA